VATIEQRRKTDRERRERWRKRKLSEGNKQMQIMITPEAQKVLKLEKERSGEPFVQIINRAIMNLNTVHPSISEKTSPRSNIPEKTSLRSNIPEKTTPGPNISKKTAPSPDKSAKGKKRAKTSDKTTAPSPEQLSLFIGSESEVKK
jgi:hypothetical protein